MCLSLIVDCHPRIGGTNKIMKYRASQIPNLSVRLSEIKRQLKQGQLVVVESTQYQDHITVYMAWLEQPGRVLVSSPLLPDIQKQHLKDQASRYVEHNDVIMFHTSGTTGMPKLIVHTRQSMQKIKEISQEVWRWQREYVNVTVVPPMTSAFWHIILPGFIEKEFEILESSKNTFKKDIAQGGPVALVVPSILDILIATKTKIDLSNYRKILSGGSQVRSVHAEYVLSHGAQLFDHAFGTTETGSPILSREMNNSEFGDYTCLSAVAGIETKLEDGELWVKGLSLCANFQDLSHHDSWYRTGDYWETGPNGLIKFLGRKDDFVKLNSQRANLNDIEHYFATCGLGECLAVPQQKLGVDWIELWHTLTVTDQQLELIKSQSRKVLIPCCVPRKFKQVSELPKTALGKRQRITV
jgi:acyl-coenzyme A synthetase/AMP-(fatty) acid ligase